MKARYDKHTVDRNFKDGDQVLALLLIPRPDNLVPILWLKR